MKNKVVVVGKLSPEEFRRSYLPLGVPVLMRGGVADWPAFGKWSPQFFASNFTNLTVKVERSTAVKGDIDDPVNFLQQQRWDDWKLADYARYLIDTPEEGTDHYLSQYRLFEKEPALRQDVKSLEEYMTPASWWWPKRSRRAWFRPEPLFWMGGPGNRSSLHFDRKENFAALFHGRKKWVFFAPGTRGLYYPSTKMNSVRSMHWSPVNVNNPDFKRFPEFRHASPCIIEMNEGDLLYNPPGWWHYVSSPVNSIMLNYFWWRPIMGTWKLRAYYYHLFRRKWMRKLGVGHYLRYFEYQHE